jgi:hypothetical protein
MCQEHFLLNCRLCNDSPVPPYTPLPDTSINITTPVIGNIELPAMPTPLPMPSLHDPGPQQPPVSSPEAVKVTNVTEEYARACDKYEEACTAVNKTEEHIQNMREILEELIKARETARMMKTALKKKVLETLAGEE